MHAIILNPQKTNATCIIKFYQSKFECGVAITLLCLPPILSQALLAFYSGTLYNISFRLDTFVTFHVIQKLLKQFSKARSLPN